MLPLKFSEEAETDIDQIAAYTLNVWGQRRLARYANELDDGLERIQNNPHIGRKCDSIRHGFRRLEIGRHVVFYTIESDSILIVRVLHRKMLPANYF